MRVNQYTPRTPCDTMPRFTAPVHGTQYAYSKYKCRCRAAIADRAARRAEWARTETGKLSIKRTNERRRQMLAAEGPSVFEMFTAERRDRGRALLNAGHSQPAVAARLGVHVRTVQRWVASWSA